MPAWIELNFNVKLSQARRWLNRVGVHRWIAWYRSLAGVPRYRPGKYQTLLARSERHLVPAVPRELMCPSQPEYRQYHPHPSGWFKPQYRQGPACQPPWSPYKLVSFQVLVAKLPKKRYQTLLNVTQLAPPDPRASTTIAHHS